jgi:hypothetical protein
MTSIVVILETDLKAGWQWVQTAALDVYSTVSGIVGEAWKTLEAVVVQDLWGAAVSLVRKLLSAVGSHTDLADLETAFLNILQTLGGQLYTAAVSLGSTVLQTILGLIQAKAAPPAAAPATREP